MKFAEPGKCSSQAGQAKVSEGREVWSQLLELNLRNVISHRHNDETWKGRSSGQEWGVVYRQKKGGEEARSFSTVRGAPQNGDGRVEADFAIMRLTAQPGHKICILYLKIIPAADVQMSM